MKRVLLLGGLGLLLFTLYSAAGVGLSNNVLFMFGISACMLGYSIYFDKLKKIRWLNYAILAGFIGILLLVAGFTIYGIRDNVTYKEEAVLVLGAGVRGEKISTMLQARLDKTIDYIAHNPDALIVVSGGQGPREDITEALAMERYLIANNVPAGQIVKEEQSTSTYENMQYSKKILDARFGADNSYTVAVITNDFHIYRSERLAKIVGLHVTHYHAGTPWYAIPANYLRECAAIVKLWLVRR